MTNGADFSPYTVDGIAPASVVMPTSLAELQDALRACNADGSAVIPCAGGTRMSVGNVPTEYDVALDLSEMPSQFEHEPGDMTVVCDANVNVGELESVLNAANQRLPFRVPLAARATIGGSVASNAGGRLRPRFGGIRDWIVGMHVVSPEGVATKSGGKVVKNVQGFELHRLHTGAYGTLGIITEAAFKLVPLPRASVTAAMWFADHESATQATALIAGGGYELDSVRLYSGIAAVSTIRDLYQDSGYASGDDDDVGDYLLLAKIAGSPASVRSQLDGIKNESGTLPTSGFLDLRGTDTEIWDYLDASVSESDLVVSFTGLPTSTARLMRRLERVATQSGVSNSANFALDGGYGTLQMSIDFAEPDNVPTMLERVTTVASEYGCDYLIERSPTAAKSGIDVFGIDASLEPIMRRTKQQYDPKSILNRGRFAFGI